MTVRANAITYDFGPWDFPTPETWGAANFWLNTERPPDDARVIWVGAGTRDTGLSFTQLTFQITHATDADTNAERDFIVDELTKKRLIEAVKVVRSGEQIADERVNHYVTDGEIRSRTWS